MSNGEIVSSCSRERGADGRIKALRARRRLTALALLHSTALAGCLLALSTNAYAAPLIDLRGQNGDGGTDGLGTNGDDGDNGQSGNPTNTTPLSGGGPGFQVNASGGSGGGGGFQTAIVTGFGGDGGDGGDGGSVDAANTATITTTGDFGHGAIVTANGGAGGSGGSAGGITAFGGDGGVGGNGGVATISTTGASSIVTNGGLAYGVAAFSVGGAGGTGGGVGGLGADAGDGGQGGVGGAATANNGGRVETFGTASTGVIATSAGGVGGEGGGGGGALAWGGNGGTATVGGAATVTNTGDVITHGAFAEGMKATSAGGGGGDGSGVVGIGAWGGAGADGNNGGTAFGSNTGTINTFGPDSIGMLVQSIGGGGGDAGGAVGIAGIGGDGAGGGTGGLATGDIGGSITTTGVGSHGALIQSVGGGGGNGGFSLGVVGVGGSGDGGGDGGDVNVNQAGAGPIINTSGNAAAGIIAQSVGGGGGDGGTSVAPGIVAVGGDGGVGGNGGVVTFNIGAGSVTTTGERATGVIAQSIGGGGGNGGVAAALLGPVTVSVGGDGNAAGDGRLVDVTTGLDVTTSGGLSYGVLAQSVGGGGGNGGASLALTAGVASVAVGGSGAAGGAGGAVNLRNTGDIRTNGVGSIGLIAQSIGGGGGNGGYAIGGALGVGLAIGGDGSTGGDAGNVFLSHAGVIETTQADATGILAQSIGGGGGNGGVGAGVGLALPGIGIGGSGSGGGKGGVVEIGSVSGSVTTRGDNSIGVFAQSIGGGGGNGGGAIGAGAPVAVTLGGSGAGGGDGGNVTVRSQAAIDTHGQLSHGVFAQSVGGGGGNGGFSTGIGFGGVAVAIGGSGSGGGNGGAVRVETTGGAANLITTDGAGSVGVFAQSVGGGGGSAATVFSFTSGLGLSVGGSGDVGGTGGTVDVLNTQGIRTLGALSHGILAQSVGGGGGNGGKAGSLAATVLGGNVAIGGSGGGGGDGSAVTVNHTGDISVAGVGARGILAQSVGGGGGAGGDADAISANAIVYYPYPSGSFSVGVGGSAADGGAAADVRVTAAGNITAGSEYKSGGIVAQSIGGGGGDGGKSNTVSVGLNSVFNVAVSVGGTGGGGGAGALAYVETTSGSIVTHGDASEGILAQSIGGGGGKGGDAIAFTGQVPSTNYPSGAVSVGIGGFGGDGDIGGTAQVINAMTITTTGDQSAGIVAQSIGGGGGAGGQSRATATQVGSPSSFSITASVGVGGFGGTGNKGGEASVTNTGAISTSGAFSHGIVAQSIGGGGGVGGVTSASVDLKSDSSATRVGVSGAVGGFAGGGNDGGSVTVDNRGRIDTTGLGAAGILAQSIGGSGGAGGSSVAKVDGAPTVGVGLSVGGFGGNGGTGGVVDVTNRAIITTANAFAYGISASSIGGGGGSGANGTSEAAGDYAIGASLGGFAADGQSGGAVSVHNLLGGQIQTTGLGSIGVFAQSIGGSGGNGGGGSSSSGGSDVSVDLTVGGFAGNGSTGGNVLVENENLVHTSGAQAHGVMAQSIGGGGGNGGSASASKDDDDADVQVRIGVGGFGGTGGKGGQVDVFNRAGGVIQTDGYAAYGVFAQSIGGGGGSGGAGQTASGSASNVAVNLSVGGFGGSGNTGGQVTVDNAGQILTKGDLSHGVFAQSVGGGGGAAAGASNAASASTSIGGGYGGSGAAGGDGGFVKVLNSGRIETQGAGALGIFAQSVGGGGGYGGTMSSSTSGDSGYTLDLGGVGGAGGNGGDVLVNVSGQIETFGARAHGVVAQSVGGGGGFGGDAGGKGSIALAIGGLGGGGGDGGDVTVIRTGTIVTHGVDSVAIIAQSVGGGGGIGGAGFGRFSTDGDGTSPDSIGFTTPGGDTGNGGKVTIDQTGEILATGDRGHGIVAQAVGGGGGFGGTSSLALGQSGAGSRGGIGDAAAVEAIARSTVVVEGASSYALFGQSATGQGNSGAVTLTANGSLGAQGADSVAVYAESTSALGKGNITVNLNGERTVGGGDTGQAVMLVGGADNVVNNHSLVYALGADAAPAPAPFARSFAVQALAAPIPGSLGALLPLFSALTISGTYGNDQFENTLGGRVIGNIDLGTGVNGFHTDSTSSFIGLDSVNLGAGGLFQNDGIHSNHGIGEVAQLDLTGDYEQTTTGKYVVDVDLDSQTTDRTDISGTGFFAGTGPLNFLSIDKLFDRYVIAQAAGGMTDDGFTPTFRPTVGFDFQAAVENGTDLVLFADKPKFEDLAKDPASGSRDPNVASLGSYFDAVEAASSPDNPMARLINMLRFLPDEATLGDALTRLTPHYAVHSLEMFDRATDIALDAARQCGGAAPSDDPLGRCVWFTVAPKSNYSYDAGRGRTTRDDSMTSFTLGGRAPITDNWALGFTASHTDFSSKIGYNDERLSSTDGDAWQFFGLAKFAMGKLFADFTAGGGFGKFHGSRDTSLAQVAFTPGETLEGVYLPDQLLDGIGDTVRYRQKAREFGLSARLGYTLEQGVFYAQPQVLLDGRWIQMNARERGSLAAINFKKQTVFAFSATPGLELGAKFGVGEGVDLNLFARGGIELQKADWKMKGQFAATEGVLDTPPLVLREDGDSPLWRVGVGAKLSTVQGLDLTVNYNGAFGDKTKLNSWSGRVAVRF